MAPALFVASYVTSISTETRLDPKREQRTALPHLLTRGLFTATIFLGAFLLFAVQPMFARMVLPLFGGSPAVWAVALCFFQTALLLGYAYAHGLEKIPMAKVAFALHIAMLALSVALLPLGVPAAFANAPSEYAYLWLLAALTAGLGLPFLVLSATAPLLQAWFGHLGKGKGLDPYVLYAASNAGSMSALISYPVIVEPLMPLGTQAAAWTIGFVALAFLIAACGIMRLRAPFQISAVIEDNPSAPDGVKKWAERAGWTFLSFVPSALLVAFTTYLTTDLASAPLLWIIPLILYLGTFILAFRSRPLRGRKFFTILQPIAVAVTLWASESTASYAWAVGCIAGLLAFFLAALVCHLWLFEKRPPPSRLTEYYFWMSAGGALGGMFASLIAPQLFTNVAEFPLLLGVAALTCLFARMPRAVNHFSWRLLSAAALLTVIVFAIISRLVLNQAVPWNSDIRNYVISALAFVLIILLLRPKLAQSAVIVLTCAVILLPHHNRPVYEVRNFFGVNRVHETVQGRFHTLSHGTTLHGAQRIYKPKQPKPPRPLPLMYYHPESSLAIGLRLARAQAAREKRPLRVGIAGLGTGAMACNSAPGETWKFYDIDKDVIEIARNPALFTYLSECQPDAPVILGDARLTLAREQPGSFDYLMIDAFSSDAIPVHLLTVEALRLYASLLSERGVLALHISNQNLDLPPVIESNIHAIEGLYGVYLQNDGTSGGLTRSQVALIAKSPDILAPALATPKSRPFGTPQVRPWTDDYSNIISALWRRYRKRIIGD